MRKKGAEIIYVKMINNPKLFCLLLLLIIELLYLCVGGVKWDYFHSYFHCDNHDTFMDYFNMLSETGIMKSAIYETKVIYPAFCFMLLDIVYSFMPESVQAMNSFDLRAYQYALFPFIVLLLGVIILLWELLKRSYGRNNVESTIFALSMIMSGPILFTIERGNMILLAFVFILIFGLYYNSENKWLRYLAYIALAISSAIKIYPALFGVLIISHKRWKETIVAIALGVGFFVLPFVKFGGVSSIVALYNNIVSASPVLANRGTGYNFSFLNIIKIVQTLFGNVDTQPSEVVRLVSFFIPIFIYLFNSEEWKRLYAITLFCIWVPEFSYTYTLVFFILPFIYFLNEDKKVETIDCIYMLLFIIMLVPTATVSFPQPGILVEVYPLSGSVMIGNAGIVTLSLFLILEGVLNILKWFQRKREK